MLWLYCAQLNMKSMGSAKAASARRSTLSLQGCANHRRRRRPVSSLAKISLRGSKSLTNKPKRWDSCALTVPHAVGLESSACSTTRVCQHLYKDLPSSSTPLPTAPAPGGFFRTRSAETLVEDEDAAPSSQPSTSTSTHTCQGPPVTTEVRRSGSLFSLCLTSHVGGRLRFFLGAWGDITGDEYVLRNVQGHSIEFLNGDIPPSQHRPGRTFKLSAAEQAAGYKEILRLEQKGVIEKTVHEPVEFVSNIFTRPKKDGGCRVIIDLTSLNTFVTYTHFKMDTFETAKSLISHGCFMACIDLQDAYYTVSIQKYYRRFLKFIWMGQLWQYRALPNGLTTAPRLFSKLGEANYGLFTTTTSYSNGLFR